MLIVLATPLYAQEEREAFTVEGTVAAWLLRPSGNVLSNGNAIDLRTDFGMSSRRTSPYIRVIFKPSQKNRAVFETIPYRLEGDQALTRSFTFSNVTYTIQDRITSRANVNYFFGGYQRDFISSSIGHVGLLAGVGYVDGDADVKSQTRGLQGTESARIPFPLIGGEFRVFPSPFGNFNINGEIKGLPLGGYGHYLHSALHFGVGLNRNLTVQIGYSYLNADIHEKNNGDGFKLDFGGPVFSIQFRDR